MSFVSSTARVALVAVTAAAVLGWAGGARAAIVRLGRRRHHHDHSRPRWSSDVLAHACNRHHGGYGHGYTDFSNLFLTQNPDTVVSGVETLFGLSNNRSDADA